MNLWWRRDTVTLGVCQWSGSGGKCRWNSVAVFVGIGVGWSVGDPAVGVCDSEERGAKCICLPATKASGRRCDKVEMERVRWVVC